MASAEISASPSPRKQCQSCDREFSVFIRPYSCELCNEKKLCSNCARKFVLSYEPDPSYLRLCDRCCEKVSQGNQLNAAKLSKESKSGRPGVWASLFGRSSTQRAKPQAPAQSAQRKYKHQSEDTSISCTSCCSSSTRKKPAVNTNQLKDQAPLFPENYNLSTPQRRKEKRNLLLHRDMNTPEQRNLMNAERDSPVPKRDQGKPDGSGRVIEEPDTDESSDYYLTMHPLNNVKLRAPKSILSGGPNQVALNISIGKGESRHYCTDLDETSLCDCFSHVLKRHQAEQQRQTLQSAVDETKATTAESDDTDTHSQSSNEEMEQHKADDIAEVEKSAIDVENEMDERNTNAFCHCVTIPIKHRKFKLLRIDLLFDDREYDELIANDDAYAAAADKRVSVNVLLHDRESQIWSGVQMVRIRRLKDFRVIEKLSLRCSQSLIKKSVSIVGSMAWRISREHKPEASAVTYPYRDCNLSQMITILTQQRYDIIDSYETVMQQRSTANQSHGQGHKPPSSASHNARNQIHPDDDDSDPLIVRDRDRPIEEVARPRLPDGGSNVPTKRAELQKCDESKVANSNGKRKPSRANQNGKNVKAASKLSNVLLATTAIPVEEMEKSMLNEEVARIESMISGLETAVCAINEGQGAANRRQYEEVTGSASSSLMFNTNELNKAKLQIADHLTKSRESNNVHFAQPLMHSENAKELDKNNNENEDTNLNVSSAASNSPIRPIPVCLSCQRCSRTIMICHHAV